MKKTNDFSGFVATLTGVTMFTTMFCTVGAKSFAGIFILFLIASVVGLSIGALVSKREHKGDSMNRGILNKLYSYEEKITENLFIQD